MFRLASRVALRIKSNPAILVALAFGILMGIALCIPLEWRLPDPVAALVGAFVGAFAAVGGAIWAANVKQEREDEKSDMARTHQAMMVSGAIAAEIASAGKYFYIFANKLVAAIADADAGNITPVVALLNAAKLEVLMSERFMGRVEVFGEDSVKIVNAIGAILDHNSVGANLGRLLADVKWSDARDIVCERVNISRHYAGAIKHHAWPVLIKYNDYVRHMKI